jgi:hypothetical protein
MSEAPSLGQLIWLVRRELEWARHADENHALRFDVGAVELEASIEVSAASSKGSGLDLTVFGVGGKAESARDSGRSTAAKVTVTFTPRQLDSETGAYEISARDMEPPPRRAASGAPDAAGRSGHEVDQLARGER